MWGGTRIASIESEALAFALQPPMILHFAADWLADGRHELGANRSRYVPDIVKAEVCTMPERAACMTALGTRSYFNVNRGFWSRVGRVRRGERVIALPTFCIEL